MDINKLEAVIQEAAKLYYEPNLRPFVSLNMQGNPTMQFVKMASGEAQKEVFLYFKQKLEEIYKYHFEIEDLVEEIEDSPGSIPADEAYLRYNVRS